MRGQAQFGPCSLLWPVQCPGILGVRVQDRKKEVNQTSDSQRQGPSDYLDNYQIPGEASVSTEEEQCEEVEAVEYEGDITRTVRA